jgi:predicted dehydrogenase
LEERAQAFADRYQLKRYYTDYRQAAVLPDVDVVSVCTPTCLHAEMSIFCVEHGKHVLCEKPMALTLEQAQQMLTAAAEHPTHLGIGFMRRHSPILHRLRDELAGGKIARPVIYTASDIRQVRPKLAMHDPHQNGGPVIDMAVHLIDTWRYVFQSEPVYVCAQGLTLAKDRPELASLPSLAIDSAVITVTFASGDIGNFNVCWGLPPGVNPNGLPDQIISPHGLAQIHWSTNQQSLRWMSEGGDWQILADSNQDLYQQEISAMAEAILDHEAFPATPQDGYAALQVAMAALESIKTGKGVYLT